jgi:valine--pyruvate aminotransferase
MQFSRFGEKFTARTGILELMDDLGTAMAGDEDFYMLGGGNPAHIPEINAIWRRRMQEILADHQEYEDMLVNYDKPQGKTAFLEALAELLHNQYGWPIAAKNIAITNGSQTSSFILLNLFSGTTASGKKQKVLFPLMPEYIGYADQAIEEESFLSFPSSIDVIDDFHYKYRVNFDELTVGDEVGAICASRPTNPTGNVLTNDEVQKLSALAAEHGVPLIIDNAYGTPFPNIIFEDAEPMWNKNIILSMSLSKIGLPSVRTGIIIADESIINALSSVNAIISLANVSIGQVLTMPIIRSKEILSISRDIVMPFYRRKSQQIQQWIREAFGDGIDYRVHKSEGSIFLWVWFRDLPITSKELYERFKKRRVLVVPGNYFFFGLGQQWKHQDECIRINYSQDEKEVQAAVEIMADELAKL